MVQIGMRGHDLYKGEFLNFAKELNANDVKFTQLAFGKAITDIDFTTGNFSTGLASYIGNTLKKYEIEVPILGCYINTVHPEQKELDANIKKFKEHLLYAKYMGAHMVGTETCTPHPNNLKVPETRTEANYQKCLSTIKILVAEAEKLGVNVGIEGVNKETLYSPELVKRLLDDVNSPNLLVIYDIVNLLPPEDADKVNEHITKCFNLFGDKIGAIHVKDFVIEKDEDGDLIKAPAPLGEGLMDFEFLFKTLSERKPFINILVEESNKKRWNIDKKYIENIYNGFSK